MGTSSRCGVFTKNTSGTEPVDQTVAFAGDFTPKFLMLWTDGQTAEATSTTHGISYSQGWTDGTNEYCATYCDEDAVDTTNTSRQISNTKLLKIRDDQATLIAECDFKSWANNEFVVTWTENTDTSATRIYYEVIGGDDITKVECGDFNAATAGGPTQTVSLTDSALVPDVAMFMCTGQTSFNSEGNDAQLCIGFGTGSGANAGICYTSDHGVDTSVVDRRNSTVYSLTLNQIGGSRDGDGGIGAFNTGAFDIAWNNKFNGTYIIAYTVIEGGTWDTVSVESKLSDGSQNISTSVTTPNGAIFMSCQTPTEPTGTDGTIQLGASDDDTVISNVMAGNYASDGDGTTLTSSFNDDALCIKMINEAGTDRGNAALITWGSSQITLDWNGTDAQNRDIHMLIFDVQDSGAAGFAYTQGFVTG